MAGIANTCQIFRAARTRAKISHSSSSLNPSDSQIHSPSTVFLAGGRRTRSESCSIHTSSGSLGATSRTMAQLTGEGVRAAQGRRKEGLVRSAVASAPTEGKEYDYDTPKMRELMAFLDRDLVHLFDEQGIDKSMYDSEVEFRDPISNYGTLGGYLFNIQLLRRVLTPKFELHSVKQTGPKDITTRWTMTMYFLPLPWKPELIFTGTSVMSVNEETGKFCRHVDYWDSIQNNDYFSFEAVGDLIKQLQWYKTPDLETPKYKVLKRTSVYEVRQYEQFLVAETPVDQVVGNQGFNEVAGYLFGKNSTGEKMKMTTPVFNQNASESSRLQFVLPLQTQMSSVPSPSSQRVTVRPVEKTFAAVIKFNGEVSDAIVREKECTLRTALSRDHLLADTQAQAQAQAENNMAEAMDEAKAEAEAEDDGKGFLLARYNDPRSTWAFMRRNEVIIWLKDFTLEPV